MKKLSAFAALLLTACVTINIYFPAAAAEKVADEIIKDIQNITPEKAAPKPKAGLSDWQMATIRLLDQAIATVISSAQAGEADLTIDRADVRQLRANMENRFPALKVFYDAGVIGLQSDGFITVRDPANVPLKDRNQVNKLIAAENSDRQKLYQAIADANGHPEWASQIQTTFAASWLDNAQPGWWHQTNGTWKQR